MHNYVPEFQNLMRRNIYKPDFSHEIKKLEFGFADEELRKKVEKMYRINTLTSLNEHKEQNLMQDLGFPHGIIHKMSIVPSKFRVKESEYEMY